MGSDIVVHFLYSVKNAERFHKGKLKDFRDVGIKVVDETTLAFELEYPSPAFLLQLSYFSP